MLANMLFSRRFARKWRAYHIAVTEAGSSEPREPSEPDAAAQSSESLEAIKASVDLEVA